MKKRNILALALAVIFLSITLYFTIFEETHLIHECTGEDCPICEMLEMAMTFAKQAISLVPILIGCFLYTVFGKIPKTFFSCSFSERNLVSDKVRLDD